MPLIVVSDGHLNYESFGDENCQDVVFVQAGIGLSGRFYHDFAQHIANLGYRVICPDHRRLGQSTARARFGFRIPDMAKDTITIADNLGIDRFHIVGESYGGMVAMGVTIGYPERVRSLVAINSSIASPFFRLWPSAFFKICHGMIDQRLWFNKITGNVFSAKALTENPKILKNWDRLLQQEGFPVITLQKQTFAALTFFAASALKKLRTPTMIIYGEEDSLVPPVNSRHIAKQIPGSKLEVLAKSGHHLCGECPAKVANLLKSFYECLK